LLSPERELEKRKEKKEKRKKGRKKEKKGPITSSADVCCSILLTKKREKKKGGREKSRWSPAARAPARTLCCFYRSAPLGERRKWEKEKGEGKGGKGRDLQLRSLLS